MVAHPIVLFLWKTLTATDFGKCLEAGYPWSIRTPDINCTGLGDKE
jgi:hypothetical protein